MTTQHVAVLMGGMSAEREVSLTSGRACAEALATEGLGVFGIEVSLGLWVRLLTHEKKLVHGSFRNV